MKRVRHIWASCFDVSFIIHIFGTNYSAMTEDNKITEVFAAVQAATGINRQTILSGSRVREHYFARMIAAYHLKAYGLTFANICPLVGVTDPTAVMHQVKGYPREKTPYFRGCAEKVEKILASETVNA